MSDAAYESLKQVLNNALSQASEGKGKERHAEEGEPFEKQQIVEIGRRLQGNPAAGPLFQAVKKIYESGRLDDGRGIHELYGAINYIAAAILLRGEVTKPGIKSRISDLKITQMKLAYLSTAHITEEDSENLEELAQKHKSLVDISEYETGFFIALYDDWKKGIAEVRTDFARDNVELSDEAVILFHSLAVAGFDFALICGEGDIIRGLQQFDW